MKKITILVFIVLACSCLLFGQVNLNNQIIVYFKSGVQRVAPTNTTANVTSTNVLNLLNTYGIPTSNVIPSFPEFIEADTVNTELGENSRQMNRAKVFTITITDPSTKNIFLADLDLLQEVLFAESNGDIKSNLIPSDINFNQQWGLRNTINPGSDIHAEAAWNIFTGNPNSIIAIIDEGVNINHNDLAAKITGGDIGFRVETDPTTGFQSSHGSLVAGTAAAITNNNLGIAGVDWNAKIHPRYVIGNNLGDAGVAKAIIESVNFSQNVWTINCSWTIRNGDNSPGRYSAIIRNAFAYAYRRNRVTCASMGNFQISYPNVIAYPAAFNSGTISVGATNNFDEVLPVSAQGSHIDVSAPGFNFSTNVNDNYASAIGTSIAAPFVSGLASLLKGYNTSLANDDIEQIIQLSADDVNAGNGFPGYDNQIGFGRINALKALQFLQAPNTVQHFSTTGGTIFNTSNAWTRTFLGVPNFADGRYLAKRIEIRKTFNLPAMCSTIAVWGRGVGTTGYREEFGRNYGEGICEVVPGSLTNNSVTLRTWVYELVNSGGSSLGYYPTSPSNVIFQYSILGIPAPSIIAGDDFVCTTSDNYTINNLLAGATVNWQANPSGVVNVNSPNSLQTTLTRLTGGSITLTATVSNACGGQQFIINKPVWVGPPSISGGTYTSNGQNLPLLIYNGGNNDYNNVCNQQMTFTNMNIQGATTVTWSRISNIPNHPAPWSQNGNDLSFYLTSVGQKTIFRLTASNTCGTVSMDFGFKSIDCSGGGGGCKRFEVSPNPAKDLIFARKIPQVPPPCRNTNSGSGKEKAFSEAAISEIRIYDNTGNLKRIQKENKSTQAAINISGFKPGVYILEILDGDYKERHRIIIQE
jgi:Subtilase family/Secretion system C-terminal sorting domain